MIKILTCKQCGESFAGYQNARYCRHCLTQREKARAKRYYTNNRQEYIAKVKAYNKKHRAEILLKNHERYYLDHEKTKIRKRLEFKKFWAKHGKRILILRKLKCIDNGQKIRPFCQHCGKTFNPTYKGQKYCSPQCYKQSPIFRLWQRIKSKFGY